MPIMQQKSYCAENKKKDMRNGTHINVLMLVMLDGVLFNSALPVESQRRQETSFIQSSTSPR